MAISGGSLSPTQSNPYASIAAGTSAPGAGIPAINLPGIQTPSVNPANLSTSSNQVYQLLSQAPQSLTSAIGPLLQQVFGTQSNLMQPIFAQQGAQGAAQAQSDAQKRGLTGSSIEAAGISSAYSSANQNYDQYLAGQLSSLVRRRPARTSPTNRHTTPTWPRPSASNWRRRFHKANSSNS